MESRTYSRRHHHHSQPPSPDLVRSRSGKSAVSVNSRSSTTSPSSGVSQRLSHRSKSTIETRSLTKNNKNTAPNSSSSPTMVKAYGFIPTPPTAEPQKTATNNKASSEGRFGGLFAAARLRGASAWALSPGRSSSTVVVSKVVEADQGKKSGGVGGVFRYFRQKKVSPVEEEGFHSFKVLCNRLIQWRFVNARAQLAVSATHTLAQDTLLSVWLQIYVMRNSLLEKRLQVQRLQFEIKLSMILNPQISLLNDWAKLDKRNQESMAVLVTTLSTLSNRLPLIHGAKVDVMSAYEAMKEAIVAMDGIVEIITGFFEQLETILYMVTELLITNKQQLENLEEFEKSVTRVATFVDKETALRTHCIQAALVLVRTKSY